MKRTPRRLIGTVVAVALMLAAIPASAQAIGLTGLSVTPASQQAGAHSNIAIHIGFTNQSDQVRNLTISLPPGVVGDPNATLHCTVAQLSADTCPTNTAVGSVTTDVDLHVLDPLPITVPLSVSGTLYNLDPQPGEPARFGIVLHALPITIPVLGDALFPSIKLQSGAALRQSDFGLDTVINDIPHTATVLGTPDEIDITGMTVTLDGTAPGPPPKPFMRNPTSCGSHVTGFSATSWSGTTTTTPVTGTANFNTTGCASEDFSPSFTAEVGGPGQTASGVPTNASTSINQDLDEAGLKRATVTVPADFNPNATLLGNPCPLASFQAHACPATSRVGFATASSPLLTQPLLGPVLLVDAGGGLPNLGLDLQGQLNLLLQGTVDLSKKVVFGDVPPGLPDIPISHFALSFPASPGFLGNGRDLCTPPPPVFHADFVGYNDATASVDTPATVDGCGPSGKVGAKCKKAKKKKRHHRAAESKKKHKKKSCKKKKRHKKHR
jgi:hypothetical protein